MPPHAPDILTARIQAIGGTRTFTLPDSQPCRLLTFLQMLFGSLWYKNIRVLHLILDNGPTHAPKQIKKWIRSLDLPFRVKIHCLPIHASRLDQVEIVLSYVQRRRRGKMIVGKTPFKSGRRKQPRIIAQFPVESRFRAGGGRFQIIQGITSNLHEEGVSHAGLREPMPASYAYLSAVSEKAVRRIRAHHMDS